MNARYAVTAMLGLLTIGAATPAGAQVRPLVGAGAGFETFSFADPDAAGIRSLTLLTIPFAARVPLGSRLSIDASGAWARGALERPDGTESTLAGLTDTQIVLNAAVVPGQFRLSGVVVLPTGKNRHSEEEAEVAGAIAADLLPFRISNWSTGGGFGLSGAWAHSFGRVGIGMSGAYVLGQEFDLFDDGTETFAYRPGNQLLLRGVLDATVGVANKLSLQVTYQKANDDQLNGANLFRAGSRVQAMTSYTSTVGRNGNAMLYGGLLHRSQGVYLLEASEDAPSEDLWLAGTSFRLPVGGIVFQPMGDLRLLRRSDGTNQGYTLSVGSALEWAPSGAVTFVPSLRARLGRVLAREDIETGFTGLDAGLIIRFGGAG